MDKYVDCIARITRRVETDGSASFVVEVDLDYSEEDRDWQWRTRNMERVLEDTGQPEHCLDYAVE